MYTYVILVNSHFYMVDMAGQFSNQFVADLRRLTNLSNCPHLPCCRSSSSFKQTIAFSTLFPAAPSMSLRTQLF